jgi:hypothetical protein
MSESDFVRAEDVITQLARRGHHRALSLPDLLIAAAAERSQLVVLHYDGDYDVIAAVTGQRVEWVAPKGGSEHATAHGHLRPASRSESDALQNGLASVPNFE